MLALVALAALHPPCVRAQSANPRQDATLPPFREVTDETGRRVNVPQPVRRIVSLAPNLTEIVYALGAQEHLVGDTDFCDYPPEAQTKPKVGGAVNPNLEQLVALKPDLVLVTTALNRRETVTALERLGIPTYATDPRTVENILMSIENVADVLGVREQGEVVVAKLRERLAEVTRRLGDHPAKRALFVVWTDPLISVGRGTFLADAMRLAGARSVVDSAQDWPKVSLEEVVRLQPDFLVMATAHAQESEANIQSLSELPGWRSLEAVRHHRVAVVSDAVNRPAPRLIDAIVELAHQLHPEAFVEPPEPGKQEEEFDSCVL